LPTFKKSGNAFQPQLTDIIQLV